VLAGATSALLAVGTVRAIRRRRQRRNHLAPSTVPIAGGDADLHRRLVADADEDLTEGLGSALDDLAEQVAVAGHTCRPLVVQHSADHLDALLDQPTLSPVDRWRAQANGEVWTLDTEVPLPIGAEATARMATPLLVTLGPPDDGGQLYLDLEAARLVSLTGDPEVARCLACTMVTELAHSPLAANVRVTVVGDGLGAESLDHLERVRVKKTWADIAADLTSWNDQSHDALVANGWPNPFAGRGHDPDHDALIPLVVVASKPPDDLETVASLTAGPAATAAVVIGDPLPGATVIECRHDRLSLPGLGLTCQPLALQPEEVDRVASLLDSADEPGGEQLVIWPDEDPGPLVSGDGPNEEYRDPPYELLVRFLGDIAVETADGGPTRLTEKQTALVAYIALRREISVDRVADAVWTTPAAGSPRKRLANAMSRCREAIGDRYLPASDGRTYRIGPGMATDVDLFERRVAAAGKMRPDQAVDVLEGALNLVRGRVFTYPSKERDSYAWIDAELWVSTWELTIAAVAQRAAVMSLDLGDPARAVRMTEHILRDAVSTHPGLTESLMRAHAANGDRQAVHRVYQAHVNALEKLDLDSVAESTADLYERLRGG
jgi:DNA-binding SARP family transcriptional activator